jgi:hypothetical protein
VLTSPEAAAVFLEARCAARIQRALWLTALRVCVCGCACAQGWREAGKPAVRLATVGGGTTAVLSAAPERPPVSFTPSKANAETLAGTHAAQHTRTHTHAHARARADADRFRFRSSFASSAELPCDDVARAAGCAVLYPASSKARAELADGLAARGACGGDCGGFTMTRLDTYTTVPATALPPGAAAAAAAADVVTFASPSAVKAYCKLLRRDDGDGGAAIAIACIGETSASAAGAAGLRRIHFPDAPGVDGWVEAVQAALGGAAPRDAELLARPRKGE